MGDQPRAGLNTNAPVFKPNTNAAVFVPGQPYQVSQPPPPVAQQPPRPAAPSQPAPVINLAAKPPAKAPEPAQQKEDAKENGAPTSSQKSEPPEEKGDWEDEAALDDESDVEETSKQQEMRKKRAEDAKTRGPSKHHINVIFIGHVDAGKSTIGGQLMYLTGMVDKRTLEKYEREAKEKNRESWYLSWCMDTNAEERDKGKTVEVGRAAFETDTRHFTILDAPGHKSFVPNMIGGASQADLAVLVISARKGEFETGFDRGGQTNEHALLARTVGVKRLIILVNKMDDPTVAWDQSRYDDIVKKLTPYLKKIGFNPKTDLKYIPVSGLTGANVKERSPQCKWYSDEAFIEYLDTMPPIRDVETLSALPVRCVVIDKFSDMGTIVMGKIETGSIAKNDTLLLMPNKVSVKVDQLWSDDDETDYVRPGENIKIKLKNIEEDAIMPGFTLCSTDSPCKVGRVFDAQVHIIDYKSLICPGFTCVLHIHAAVEEITITGLLATVVKGQIGQKHPRFIKEGMAAFVRIESSELFCLDTFKDFEQMGRIMLRDEGKTIGIGKVVKVIE